MTDIPFNPWSRHVTSDKPTMEKDDVEKSENDKMDAAPGDGTAGHDEKAHGNFSPSLLELALLPLPCPVTSVQPRPNVISKYR